MKKYIIVLALAVLILAFAVTVQGKHQSADVQSEIDGGHHNTIITDVDQVSQAYNGNIIPYGQLKKVANIGKGEQAGSDLNQFASIDSRIVGGHHNTIAVNSKQTATSASGGSSGGSETSGMNWTDFKNLSQALSIESQIYGGHHNVIMVDSSQYAGLGGSTSGNTSENISQVADISSLISGGHHNVILIGSSQTYQADSMMAGWI